MNALELLNSGAKILKKKKNRNTSIRFRNYAVYVIKKKERKSFNKPK